MNAPAVAPPSWQKLLRDGVVGSGIVNAILNGAIGWAITRATPVVPLWGATSIAFDTTATLFGVAFGTLLAATSQVRNHTPPGPAPWEGSVTQFCRRLPSDAVLRSIAVGLLCALPAPLLILGFVATGVTSLSAPAFILYKSIVSAAEGAAVAALATVAVGAERETRNRIDRALATLVEACGRGLARLTGWHAALLGAILALPTLGIGWALDDHYHRLLLLGVPGSERLARSYPTLYSIANGNPTENLWLAEQGIAPWWILRDLKVAFWRPLSELTHRLDYALWPDQAFLMHAQNAFWFCATLLSVGSLYRAATDRAAVAGLATLLFAVDHTHALPVGWIANRNALVGLCLGAIALTFFVKWRRAPRPHSLALASLAFAGSLLSSEASLAVLAYAAAYALCVDRAPARARALSLAPFVVIVVIWRVVYRGLGFGAHGSGLYIDPLMDPLYFFVAVGERLPVLILGQFALPPAEAYYFAPPPLPQALWVGGWLVALGVFGALGPLLIRDRQVRFWALGTLLALIPACSTYANNRLLTFVSIGAMALLAALGAELARTIAQATRLRLGELLVRAFALGLLGVHLVAAPILLVLFSRLPLALAQTVDQRAVDSAVAGTEVTHHDLMIVSAPDISFVNQIRFVQWVHRGPQPRRLRALSLGPVALAVTRTDPRTLDVTFDGGLLSWPLSELYRDARLTLPVGHRVVLDGMEVTVTGLTDRGLPQSARFRFERPLDSSDFKWVTWKEDRYVPFAVPEIGATVSVAPATNPLAPHGAPRGANPAASR